MMDSGFFALFQLLNIGVLVLWLALVIITLFQIRKRALSGSSQIIWTLIVLLIPVLGALAFLIVSPKE